MHDPSRPTNGWRPLALVLAATAAGAAVLYRYAPYGVQAYLPWPLLALALFAGARLPAGLAVLIALGVQGATDLAFYLDRGWEADPPVYIALVLNVSLGRIVAGRSPSVPRAVGAGALGYVVFFLVTNFGSWIASALPQYNPHTVGSLLLAYGEGLEFIRTRPGQAFGHLLCCGLIFHAHAVLAKAYFPAERVGMEVAR